MASTCGCGKVYKTKRGFDTHAKNCDKVAAPVAEVVEPVVVDPRDRKIAELTSLFVKFENMLYGEGTVAEKAREDIISLMIIRLLEPQFRDGRIDIMDIEKYQYNRVITTDNIRFVCMKDLALLQQADIVNELAKIWRLVFSVHQVTKQLFKADRYLSVRSDVLLSAMVRDLAAFDFESYPMDCLAEVYQHFIHKQFKGEKSSRLGQHFTPQNVIKHMLDNAEDYLIPGGSFCDPFCGTGGFLLAGYDKLKLLTDLPASAFLNGTEIDIDVYRYAVANMLIRTGSICTNVKNASAFDPATKYNMIFSNPPFGGNIGKGTINTDFATVKTNSRNLLCLQLCMQRLLPGGICSIVFPFGSEMFSARNAELEVRKKLITQHEIIGITYLPKGTFEYTGIGTVILTFRNTEGEDAPTGDIEFYEFADGVKKHLRTVTRDQLIARKYSLNVADYREKVVRVTDHRFEMKKLGELIEFVPKTKAHLASEGLESGLYKFYTSSATHKYIDQYDFEGPNILLGNGGTANVHLATKFAISDHMIILKVTGCDITYLYYYLCNNLSMLNDLFTGAGLKNLSKESIVNIDVPVPSIEYQQEIVSVINRMVQTLNSYSNVIDGLKFEINLHAQKSFNFPDGVEKKKLGEMAKIDHGNLNTKDMVDGVIPFYRCTANNPSGTHNTHTFDGEKYILFISGGGSENNKTGDNVGLGNVYLVNGKTACNSHVYRIVLTTDNVLYEYLYSFMKLNKAQIATLATFSVNLGNISITSLREFEIPIPDHETQKKITSIFDTKNCNLEKIKQMFEEQKIAVETVFKQMIEEN